MTPPPPAVTRQPFLKRVDGRLGAPLAVAAGGAVSAVAAVATGNVDGILAALAATVVVVAFFWTGAIPVLLVGGDTSRAGLGFLVLMTTYVLRLVTAFAVVAVAAATTVVDRRWMAVTIIALTLVWTSAQVALLGRSRVLLEPVDSRLDGPPAPGV